MAEETEKHQQVVEINQILNDARNAQTQIKRNITLAESKVKVIESFSAIVEQLRQKIENSDTGTGALYNKIVSVKQQIEGIKNDSQTKLTEIDQQASSVTVKVQEIEKFYTQFEILRAQVEDKENGLDKIHQSASGIKQQIEGIKNDSQTKLTEIDQQASSVTVKVQEIEKFYTQFEILRAQVEDEKTGLQAVLGVATEMKNEITKMRASSDENFRQIKNLNEESSKLKEVSSVNTEKIKELKETSENYKNDIETTFRIATDVSLANSFKVRKDEIQKEKDKWLKYLAWLIPSLTIAVLLIYFSQYIPNGPKPVDWKFWYRFAFTSPLIYAIYFATHHYNKERDLLEKYAFKFALSLSLQSYVNLLSKNFPEDKNKDQLIVFSLKSIDTVYKEPFSEKDKRRRFILGIKSFFNFAVEDTEVKKIAEEYIKSESTKQSAVDNPTEL